MQSRQRSYRFICMYRAEPRVLPGVSEKWRGWIQLVPSALSIPDADSPMPQRRWFRSLDEIPAAICELMADQ